jgi:hypothetical protein
MWPRRRHRVDRHSAAERLAAAEREVEVSRQSLAETRRDVVEPMHGYAAQNSFAQLIADGLFTGHRKARGT